MLIARNNATPDVDPSLCTQGQGDVRGYRAQPCGEQLKGLQRLWLLVLKRKRTDVLRLVPASGLSRNF